MSKFTLDVVKPDGSTQVLEATDEQAQIIEYAMLPRGTRQNLLINALAGAAKTSTLRFLCKYMPLDPKISLAFNKRIADEMGKVLPGHVRCATMNSVGHRVWGAAVGKRLVVDTQKNGNIVKAHIDSVSRKRQGEIWEVFADLTKAIGRAKVMGYVPEGVSQGRSLASEAEFIMSLEEAPDAWFVGLVNNFLIESIKQSYAGLVDFDDQIYMPTLFGGAFPQFADILGDEAQDFSPLNQAMIEKLVGPGAWLAAVGDPWQSIYAFRGADTRSMHWLRNRFNMHDMGLSISFRCPISVVRNAHKRVPHMKWAPWAKEGLVHTFFEWSAKDIPENSAIICRNNAPLMKMALKLLGAERGVHLIGTDLGPQLVRTMRKLGGKDPDLHMPRVQVMAAIDAWEQDKLARARDAGSIADRAECLRVFASYGPTLGGAIAYCERIFAEKGTIQLMSGHKAKGLEFDTAFHLDPHRIPSPWSQEGEALEQERNVEYVIETRPRESLYFARLDQFNGGETP